jgi:RNA recognition motif-containing protein
VLHEANFIGNRARNPERNGMSKKIYVGNLSYSSTDPELEELFGQYGEVVSAKVIMDRETQRSRGFGFVEMADDDAATAAISALDGQDLGGRKLRVNEAIERERRPRRDRF